MIRSRCIFPPTGQGTFRRFPWGIPTRICRFHARRPRVKGCAVAAWMAGVKAPGDLSGVALAKPEAPSGRERNRYTQDDLRRKDTWANL